MEAIGVIEFAVQEGETPVFAAVADDETLPSSHS
jgi:hypothetical protein